LCPAARPGSGAARFLQNSLQAEAADASPCGVTH
ncbi:hypothetical protein H8958_007022, partial [Nasalis larvatus]